MSSHFFRNDPSACLQCTQLKDWLLFPLKLGHRSIAGETFCQEEDYILDLASPRLSQQCLHQDFTQEYDSLRFLIKSQLLWFLE